MLAHPPPFFAESRAYLELSAKMASLRSSAVRQASRLASRRVLGPASLRKSPAVPHVVASALPGAPRRSYVSETQKNSAQVAEATIETAIHLDRAQLEKAGLAIGRGQGKETTPVAREYTSYAIRICPTT
jgi:cysteine desulfurase